MTIDVSLTGKTAVVTGASSGIGRAIADAVLYAVSAPLRLNVHEVVVRPAKQLQL